MRLILCVLVLTASACAQSAQDSGGGELGNQANDSRLRDANDVVSPEDAASDGGVHRHDAGDGAVDGGGHPRGDAGADVVAVYDANPGYDVPPLDDVVPGYDVPPLDDVVPAYDVPPPYDVQPEYDASTDAGRHRHHPGDASIDAF